MSPHFKKVLRFLLEERHFLSSNCLSFYDILTYNKGLLFAVNSIQVDVYWLAQFIFTLVTAIIAIVIILSGI